MLTVRLAYLHVGEIQYIYIRRYEYLNLIHQYEYVLVITRIIQPSFVLYIAMFHYILLLFFSHVYERADGTGERHRGTQKGGVALAPSRHAISGVIY